jgi:hypothetical protein
MSSFDEQLQKSKFFQQVIAELHQQHTTLKTGAEQAIAIVATVAARQLDAQVLAQNLERIEALFSKQAPNEVRSEMIHAAISLVRNSGTPAGQSH